VNNYDTRFFLTGGTALSRGYYNHRYSDEVRWIKKPDWDVFCADIDALVRRLRPVLRITGIKCG
jgi:hypothetical protein